MCPAGRWAGVTLPAEEPYSARPGPPAPWRLPSKGHVICKHDAEGQDRKKTPFCTEILLESERSEEGGRRGLTLHSVDLALPALLHTGVERFKSGKPTRPHPRGAGLGPPRCEAAAMFLQDTTVREAARVPLSPERVHLDKGSSRNLGNSEKFIKKTQTTPLLSPGLGDQACTRSRACWLWGALWWREARVGGQRGARAWHCPGHVASCLGQRAVSWQRARLSGGGPRTPQEDAVPAPRRPVSPGASQAVLPASRRRSRAVRLPWRTGCSVACCREQGWPPAAGSTAAPGPGT